MKRTFYLVCWVLLVLTFNGGSSFGAGQTAPAADATPDAYKPLLATIQAIEKIIRQRAPVGSSKTKVVAQLETRRKAKKATVQHLRGEALKRAQVIYGAIQFYGYDPQAVGEVIYSMESFTLRSRTPAGAGEKRSQADGGAQGQVFRAGMAFLFSKQGKLLKTFLVALEGQPTLAEVKRMLHKEVPLGRNRASVEAWLKSKKITYSYISDKEYDLDDFSDVWRRKHRAKDLSGFIRASIHGVGYTLPVSWDIRMVFFFGKDAKLKDYSVSQVGYGP